MNAQKSLSHPTLLALLFSILALCGGAVVIRSAQSTSSAPNSSVVSQRFKKLVNLIPSHLPIKVKVNNSESENWEDELSVEVTNTSTKPIYLLELYLVMPDIKKDGTTQTGFSLRYGRSALINFSAPIQPDDVPIKPGEIYTFTLPADNVKNWKAYKSKNKVKPKKLNLIFVQINYGDRTGFQGTDGMPVPTPARACNEEQKQTNYIESVKAKLNHPKLIQSLPYFLAPASFFSESGQFNKQ